MDVGKKPNPHSEIILLYQKNKKAGKYYAVESQNSIFCMLLHTSVEKFNRNIQVVKIFIQIAYFYISTKATLIFSIL